MFLWLSFIPAPHALAIRADGSAVFARSITTWWRFFDAFENLPLGAITGVAVAAISTPRRHHNKRRVGFLRHIKGMAARAAAGRRQLQGNSAQLRAGFAG
ncbi:MAG: hypothetical protein FJX33_10925 [Alphaproteobacteria bacterium]|nr:hypothetical protein [Alphaproteobacteria bacterium]